MNKKIITGVAIGLFLIIVLAIGTEFWLGNNKKSNIPAEKLPIYNSQINVQNSNSANSSYNNILDANFSVLMQDKEVEWYGQPKSIESPKLFKKNKAPGTGFKAWEVGKIKSNEEKIIFVSFEAEGPGGVMDYVFVTDTINNEQRLQPHARYSAGNFLESIDNEIINDNDVVMSDFGYNRIISLEYPGFLSFNDMTFRLEGDEVFDDFNDPFFHPEKFDIYKKIYSDKIYGDIWLNNENGGIYLKSPIGIAKVYSLQIDVNDDNDISKITWNDGVVNEEPYTYKTVGGCGTTGYVAIASSDEMPGGENDLVQIGKVAGGDPIYGLKDSNAGYLKKWYKENKDSFSDGLSKETGELFSLSGNNKKFTQKTTYEQFINNHLMFFWKDSLGRWIRFLNKDYVLGSGGCAKPVVYLYPQRKTEVSVRVIPSGGITVSDPDYKKGWDVIADPGGALTNLSDGKKYPYLFWEGRSDSIYKTPEGGFVAAKENLENLLNEKLSLLGLNEKEIIDFKEFWLPKMLSENKPYYFITFVSMREINRLAPLKINPRPDTIIRVLMDYKGLDNYEAVPELKIKTPERKGFTAVEWGGVLR